MDIPFMGFLNTHAICYFNALVQSLLSCSQWVRLVLEKRLDPGMEMLHEFFSFMESDRWDVLFPLRLLQTMKKVASHQSSSEYFLHLLEAYPHMESLVKCTFQFEQRCGGCGHHTTRRDVSCNPLIAESFHELFQYDESIADLSCDRCKTRQTHQVNRRLLNAPPIIAVSLNKYLQKRSVNCPLEFRHESFTYRLKACIDHHGVLGAGHYVARISRNGQNALANDMSILPLPALDASSPDIYMMFYERPS